jgi:peptidoglycan/xylan/chitin deacetylase (PgdA/CDA1 family)
MSIFGKTVRSVPVTGATREIFLTFDDGPDETGTPQVLELLAKHKVKATFFVVAERAKEHHALLAQIQQTGHAIGNHSLDHRYGPYFHRSAYLKRWLGDAENILSQLTGAPTVGFRPPAGVQTPELHRAARELGLPIILWNERFFDSVFRWDVTAALKSSHRLTPGSIVLLHDRQKPKNLSLFLRTLGIYIEALSKRGFEFRALSRALYKGD